MTTTNTTFYLLFFLLFSSSFISSVSATPPAKIVSGIASNIASALFKWLWSLKPARKIGMVVSSRSMVKYEGGYDVETVFDGSKLGIEPYSVEIAPSGELLVLDSQNSNVHKVSTPLSRYSRPKLLAGSSEGYFGHVDGKPRESRMNHPKGLTVDDRGNVYVADTMNMAIRKISDTGVVTIAGGNLARGTGHIDGPSDNAKFSDDFDIIYVASSCSILVIDRGNQAIREIPLHEDDCSSYQYDGEHHLGIAVLGAAVFFGFMLALLQRRISSMFSSQSDPRGPRPTTNSIPPPVHQRSLKSVRPPLIPPEDEYETEDEGLFGSLGKILFKSGAAAIEMFSCLFISKKKPLHPQLQMNYQQPPPFSNTWPMQESFVIPRQDAPPPLETRKPYPFTSKNSEPAERPRPSKQTRYLYSGQNAEHFNDQQQMQQFQQQQYHSRQQHHQKHYSSGPQTYYEENSETTNEVVFGAVQEQDGKHEAMVIKAVDYSKLPNYGNPNVRSRYNYMGYAYGSYT
ncbi:uncharacterized protein [Rutidosis leptorrhynchoides]|uniref:uncharacterized protein n=1 Tax=Rutidosis leptorrhynchoides TaxID=125765 RepID=UPI003A990E3A